jgi:hypothetical protein
LINAEIGGKLSGAWQPLTTKSKGARRSAHQTKEAKDSVFNENSFLLCGFKRTRILTSGQLIKNIDFTHQFFVG